MNVNISGLAKQSIFEVMMLQIGEGVGHIGLAREERLFPNHLGPPLDARHAANIGRRCAHPDLRPEACGTQFRMGEIEIVHPLGHMIGEFIGESEADAEGHSIAGDDIDAGHFRLFAAIKREAWRHQRFAGAGGGRAIALIEPFRLHADLAWLGLAAFKAHAEDLHRIGQVLLVLLGQILVHGIARRRRAQMGEAGAGQVKIGRIGMANRRQEIARGIGAFEIEAIAKAMFADHIGERL